MFKAIAGWIARLMERRQAEKARLQMEKDFGSTDPLTIEFRRNMSLR